MVAGPVGAAAGAIIGGVAGGYAGKALAEQIDPTAEDAYWQEHFSERDYFQEGADYGAYQPAYRYGWESRTANADRTWEESQADLERNWQQRRGTSKLTWKEAEPAARDAWERIDRQYGQPPV
ncbi:hypothetical protein [Planctomicrobium sp. SH664]|uniref:hypothetical protein n=1 Tax=Planctomicrobium sp. SH664 TaxID=3448125 RepID=UPI003F5C4DD9